MKAAFERIRAELGRELADLVCVENPSRVVQGQDILPLSIGSHKEAD
jgi:hypothetical protein